MVTITDIGNQKNKNKFNLFVDGQFYSGINKETAATYNLFIGKKLHKAELDQILLESESKQAFNKAADYLSVRLHSKNELAVKLIKKGYTKPAINLAIQKLEEYGYINDAEFAKNFVNNNPKLSKVVLQNKLMAKGISRDIIAEAVLDVSDEQQQKIANTLALKFIKNKKPDGLNAKLYAHLARKGFSSAVIKRAIASANLQAEDWED